MLELRSKMKTSLFPVLQNDKEDEIEHYDTDNAHIDDYEDVSNLRTAKVWLHFLSSKVRDECICKHCGKLFRRGIKCSTTNMKKHLRSHHNINVFN